MWEKIEVKHLDTMVVITIEYPSREIFQNCKVGLSEAHLMRQLPVVPVCQINCWKMLIELSTECTMQMKFQLQTPGPFWFHASKEYADIGNEALKVFLLFALTYLRKAAFSNVGDQDKTQKLYASL